jgi:hypothetical protein
MRIHLLTKSVLVFCAILPFFCCVTWQAAHAGAIRLPSWVSNILNISSYGKALLYEKLHKSFKSLKLQQTTIFSTI